jgi:hypothetical protein
MIAGPGAARVGLWAGVDLALALTTAAEVWTPRSHNRGAPSMLPYIAAGVVRLRTTLAATPWDVRAERHHARTLRTAPGMGTRCATPAAITGSTSAFRVTEIWWPQNGHSGRVV